jgi:hypothetical protein
MRLQERPNSDKQDMYSHGKLSANSHVFHFHI